MLKSFLQPILLIGLILTATLGVAHADDDPLRDPAVQKTLRAMSNASIWYHPDQFGEFAGMRRYAHHYYPAALKYFKIGAYYADKLSQLSIGLMYLNGEGVAKDPVTAYAWLSVAAERDYPDFVATRDRVKAGLTPEQLQNSVAILTALQARYGDAVAKPRMARQLRLGMEQMTGSHTGFDFGAYHQSVKQNCSGGTVVGNVDAPEAGCGGADIYAESRWVPEKYFASRDALWKATVSVGALKGVGNVPVSTDKSVAPAPVPVNPPDQH